MANEIKLIDAILNINPNATCSIKENNVDKITWLDGTSTISKTDILAKQTELQTAYDNNAYARKRAIEYPSVQDFMEAYTEKEIGGSSTKWDAYKTAYNKVRSDNPKE
jgi:hypothetical protein|tara:strand:- start:14 stop:337 length:324 start_codon:yes stop_codon:yes gene_type:complete